MWESEQKQSIYDDRIIREGKNWNKKEQKVNKLQNDDGSNVENKTKKCAAIIH